ncbi:MAG: DUF3817 domain-containing protein [Nannocystaceae bacterium]|nr:DUF3817 domain-containing protein [Nannocystaceae bacterium]
MLTGWLAFRLLKFLGLGLWCAGLGGALVSRDQARRLWSVHVLATLGLALSWIAGHGLSKIGGHSFSAPWIATSLLASLLALHEAAAVAQRRKVSAVNVGLAVGAFACSVGSMVVRSPGVPHTVAAFVIPGAIAIVCFGLARRAHAAYDYDPAVVAPATLRWFLWIARLEGASLIALLGIYMPFKFGLKIVLDGGQGWFGWIHGVMVLLFMQALWSASRVLGWSWTRTVAGFVASLVPFGTFVFERRLRDG